ncbi:MAG: peptide-methionine (S)-S-oxide reductase MsrA, partial [Acetobacteraceae bacterium]
MAEATLAGGCFWCLEAVYLRVAGVTAVQSGYAGGHVANPTYREVCSNTTGHAETVRITYDPARISYADLLRIFFTIHDPTTLDRQGQDVGTQYRSVIFYNDAEQEKTARAVMDEIAKAGIWEGKIVTEIRPLEKFWPAESEHDDY